MRSYGIEHQHIVRTTYLIDTPQQFTSPNLPRPVRCTAKKAKQEQRRKDSDSIKQFDEFIVYSVYIPYISRIIPISSDPISVCPKSTFRPRRAGAMRRSPKSAPSPSAATAEGPEATQRLPLRVPAAITYEATRAIQAIPGSDQKESSKKETSEATEVLTHKSGGRFT